MPGLFSVARCSTPSDRSAATTSSWAWATGRARPGGRRVDVANGSLNGPSGIARWIVALQRLVGLHALRRSQCFDLVTNMPFRDLSMSQYNDTLAGASKFPYQWRVLAFWMPRRESVHLDPHYRRRVKTLSLAASAAMLYASRRRSSRRGACSPPCSICSSPRRRSLRRLRDLFHQRLPRRPLVVRRRVAIPPRLVGRRARGVCRRWAKKPRCYRLPRHLRALASARRGPPRDRLCDPDRCPAHDVSRAARAVGLVGHLQAQRAVCHAGPAGDRQSAARQPEGHPVSQRVWLWAWRAWRRTRIPTSAIVDILDAPPPPTVELSPSRDVVALLERASMPTIAELSQPMLGSPASHQPADQRPASRAARRARSR